MKRTRTGIFCFLVAIGLSLFCTAQLSSNYQENRDLQRDLQKEKVVPEKKLQPSRKNSLKETGMICASRRFFL